MNAAGVEKTEYGWTIWGKYLIVIFLTNIVIEIAIIFYKLKSGHIFMVYLVLNKMNLYKASSKLYLVSTQTVQTSQSEKSQCQSKLDFSVEKLTT